MKSCLRLTALLLLLATATRAYAQSSSPFTVLSNVSDTANGKLYVEIMYQRPACGDFKATFRLESVGNPGGSPIAVDSFLNNHGTFETEAVKPYMSLLRPQAGGYLLRFALPKNAHVDSGYRICVEAGALPYLCVGCGATGSGMLVSAQDIDSVCPYHNSTNDDLIACWRRESPPANWEAWIRDPRDCQPYRIVRMLDGYWWFAQNLSYTKDLKENSHAADSPELGSYWCPSGASMLSPAALNGGNAATSSGGSAACKTYGALYAWNTATALNGRGAQSAPTPFGAVSQTQGICPPGWVLPSDFDWGRTLNAVEDSCSAIPSPCNNNRADDTAVWGGLNGVRYLKSVVSAPPHASADDTAYATVAFPAGAWHRADYKGKIAAPLNLGIDKLGFSLLPAGYRGATPSSFMLLGGVAYLWSSTEGNADNAWSRQMWWDSKSTGRATLNKSTGASVRCMKPEGDLASFTFHFNTHIGSADADYTPAVGTQVSAIATFSNTSQYTFSWNGSAYGNNASYTFTMPSTAGQTVSLELKVKSNQGVVVMEQSRLFTACPYTGADRVASSCTLRQAGAQNWQAKIRDARDGKQYNIVQLLDNNWWLAQNLNYQNGLTHYGTATQPTTIDTTSDLYITTFWCPPTATSNTSTGGDLSQCSLWGAIYPWQAAMGGAAPTTAVPSGVQGICPTGWHMPSRMEWSIMLDTVEGGGKAHQNNQSPGAEVGNSAGRKLKSAATVSQANATTVAWVNSGANGTDLHGFGVVPAGYRGTGSGATFSGIGTTAFLHSTSNGQITGAQWLFAFYYNQSGVTHRINANSGKGVGGSVRCVAD